MFDSIQEKPSSEKGMAAAVIGLACRFPGSKNVEEFWENLKNGVECISFFSEEELREAGVQEELLNNINYVKARGLLENKAYFDSSFFDYSPKEAEVMDPQMRILLECSWEAMENAGYNADTYKGLVGVYVGASAHLGWEALALMLGQTQIIEQYTSHHLYDKDHINTRISYNLNLKGPSINVQSACSTTLVAIHMACQGLFRGECHVALAGGGRISLIGKSGYLYSKADIVSPDGHCRAFDARAEGTLYSEGIGVVILKCLDKALEDGDCIHAVIKGSAVNNSGKSKGGYAAPNLEGQVAAIQAALRAAGVNPQSIGYIETHGTGTLIGDGTELASLQEAYKTDKKGFYRIGSVKTNLGHFDAGSGIAGFIKTVLALKHKSIPPSLHFENPNSKIDLQNTPFIVNTGLTPWSNEQYPLRAGVSSFGVGGSHAHIILEQAPETSPFEQSPGDKKDHLLPWSARSPSALQQMTVNLKECFEKNPTLKIADTAYTLQVGRKAFRYRKMLVCTGIDEVLDAVTSLGEGKISTGFVKKENPPVIFLFPAEGFQYMNIGLDLYRTEPVFHETMDHCFGILKKFMEADIKKILYPSEVGNGNQHPGNPGIHQVEIAAAVTFIFEYALAKLLIQWGIKPYAVMGHRIGELAGICLAGIFTLEDSIEIAVLKGRLEQEMNSSAKVDVLKELEGKISRHRLHKPQIPFISNLTGEKVKEAEALDPSYWTRLIGMNAHFPDGLEELIKANDAVPVQLGPGNDKAAGEEMIHLVRGAEANAADRCFLLNQIGLLWLKGVEIDWSGFCPGEKRYRVSLPAYPFESRHFPIPGDPFKLISKMLSKNPGWQNEW